MAHTPGPWIAILQRGEYSGNYCIGRKEYHSKGPLMTFASVLGPNDICAREYAASAKENATLMAAAPDLLEALTELAELMQDVIDGIYKPDSFTLQPARAAIAKARGETE